MATMLELNGSPRTLPNNQLALDNQIQCEEFLTTPMVVYFLLKSPVGPATQRSIGRLWLYGQLQAAALLPPDRDVPAFNIMDEAQQLVSASLPIILAMARSHKIGCLLAHQSLDQLKLGDLDLTQIMLSTTAYKQIFRASDLIVRDYLTKTGGEALYHDLNWGQEVSFRNGEPDERKLSPLNAWRDATGKTPSFRVSERVGPALDSNSIMDNSADPNLSLVNISEDSGLANFRGRWTPVVSGYHITEEEYEERSNTPWPKGDPTRVVVPLDWEYARRHLPPVPGPQEVDELTKRVQKRLGDLEQPYARTENRKAGF